MTDQPPTLTETVMAAASATMDKFYGIDVHPDTFGPVSVPISSDHEREELVDAISEAIAPHRHLFTIGLVDRLTDENYHEAAEAVEAMMAEDADEPCTTCRHLPDDHEHQEGRCLVAAEPDRPTDCLCRRYEL